MNPSFRERLREIITDCVITGYENANKLIDKTEAEILSLVRGCVPDEKDLEDTPYGWTDGFNAARQAILNEIGGEQ